jgi:hypothetical protein
MSNPLLKKTFTKEKLYDFYFEFRKFYRFAEKLKKDGYITRLPNIDSAISENLIRFIVLETVPDVICSIVGDLSSPTIGKIECKYFSSSDPMSFSPTSYFDMLYILDGTDLIGSGHLKLYKINVKSTDDTWKQLKINKKDTFETQSLQKRRPRLSHESILRQLRHLTTVEYDDNIDKLLYE